MPRKKGRRGGVDNGPTGRRNQRWKRGGPSSASRPAYAGKESEDEEGVLRIGGVVLRVNDEGRVLSRRRKGGQQQGSAARERRPAKASAVAGSESGTPSGSESSEAEEDGEAAAVRDYLENAEGSQRRQQQRPGVGEGGSSSSSDEGSGSGSDGDSDGDSEDSQGLWKRLKLLQRFSGVDLGGIEDADALGGSGSSGSESEEDESGDDSSASSDDSSSSGGWEGEGGYESSSSSEGGEGVEGAGFWGAGEAGVLSVEELEGLSLELRYPVQARPQLPALPGQAQQGGGKKGSAKKRGKPGVKGAQGGKLAPGEKARLRKERITAKRAARAASRGFDLAWVNKEMQDMVSSQGDMKAFPPMGKHECKAVQRLAALYGLKSGVQGSSKRKFVVVTSTERSALPQGEALLQVGHLLAAQVAYEVNGTALVAGPAAAAAVAAGRGAEAGDGHGGGGKRGGRWAGLRGSRGSGGGSGGRAASAGPPKKAAKKRRPPKPVAFVSGGAINPDESVEVLMAAAASPRSPAACPPPDSDAVLASSQSEGSLGDSPGLAPPPAAAAAVAAAAGPAAATAAGAAVVVAGAPAGPEEQDADEEKEEWGPGRAGLGSGTAAAPAVTAGLDSVGWLAGGNAGLGFGSSMGAAAEPVVPGRGGAQGTGLLLEVFEDLKGSDSDGDIEDLGGAGGEHPGLGSQRAAYTRVAAATVLGSPRSPSTGLAGVGPGEGITNAGRLLGLGLALGVGPQVFGAPVASPRGGDFAREEDSDDGDAAAFLNPLPSRSELRKLQRRRSRQEALGGMRGPPPGNAAAMEVETGEGPSGSTRRQGAAQKPQKGGRSKQERRRRGRGGSEPEEVEDAVGGAASLVSGDYGYFERHTTGIGSKLLAKWGFQGEGSGLGREGRGIAEPLQAQRRAKGLGLGAFK